MLKFLIALLVLLVSWTAAFPAEASTCRRLDGHQICILDITRSAKNYWEYTARVSIDGTEQPTSIYNCRDRLKLQKGRSSVPFASRGPGSLICSLFKR